MLVLTRKVGESIRIADNIEVVVIEIRQGKARLGFRCPVEIPIVRKEIYDRDPVDGLLTLTKGGELVGV